MNQTEKLVRQFLLESRFKDETLVSLHRLFQSHFDSLHAVMFEDFQDAFQLFEIALTSDWSSIDSNERKISSNDRINPIYLTEAYFVRSELYELQTFDELAAILNDSMTNYFYDDLSLEALTEAYDLKKDYTLYRVDISQTRDIRTIEYSVTAEELAKQVENARKEIESRGKVVAL